MTFLSKKKFQVVERETLDAEKIKAVVLKEEEKVNIKVGEAKEIKDQCDAELAEGEFFCSSFVPEGLSFYYSL